MTIKSAILEYNEDKKENALEALDQLEKLLEESKEAGVDLETIITCYRDLIVKGLLDPNIGGMLVIDLRTKHNI